MECAINPCIPKLKTKKLSVAKLINKLLDRDSLVIKSTIHNTIAIAITILNIRLDMGSNYLLLNYSK